MWSPRGDAVRKVRPHGLRPRDRRRRVRRRSGDRGKAALGISPVAAADEGRRSGAAGTPGWPGRVALLAVGFTYAALSAGLRIGPRWWLVGLVIIVSGALAAARRRERHDLARVLALVVIGAFTLAIAGAAVLLIATLPDRRTSAPALLRDAGLIWGTNLVVFAVWYWETDGGGPARRRREGHTSEDFLFPQLAAGRPPSDWSPGFVDYLFLAFTTSTTFGPADTAVLSRRAKLLTMGQALVSLLVVAVLAARAINTL